MLRFPLSTSQLRPGLILAVLFTGLFSCSVLQKPDHSLIVTHTGIRQGADSLRFQLTVWKNMMPGPSKDRSIQLSLDVISEGLDLTPLSLDSVHVDSQRPMNATWRVRFSAPSEKRDGIWTYGALGKGLLWSGTGSIRAKIFGRYDGRPFVHDAWTGRIQITH